MRPNCFVASPLPLCMTRLQTTRGRDQRGPTRLSVLRRPFGEGVLPSRAGGWVDFEDVSCLAQPRPSLTSWVVHPYTSPHFLQSVSVSMSLCMVFLVAYFSFLRDPKSRWSRFTIELNEYWEGQPSLGEDCSVSLIHRRRDCFHLSFGEPKYPILSFIHRQSRSE